MMYVKVSLLYPPDVKPVGGAALQEFALPIPEEITQGLEGYEQTKQIGNYINNRLINEFFPEVSSFGWQRIRE